MIPSAIYQITGINPEPWTSGTAYRRGRGAGIAKDAGLVAYQEAIKEMLRELVKGEPIPKGTPIVFDAWFWRQLVSYRSLTSDRMVTKHRADLSNMVKALEDACQGVLFVNDRDVVRNSGAIIAQEKDIEPLIRIRISDPDASMNRAV